MGTAQGGVAGYIAAWQPSSAPPQAAAFARQVVAAAGPGGTGPRTCCGRPASWPAGRSCLGWSRCRRCCCTRR